jgi:hypothetical protein
MGLPEVEERLSHGEPAWFVQGKKLFVMFADRHHDDRVAFWCAAPAGIQEVLIAEEPTRYFRPPYVGPRGWIGVYLDVDVDWQAAEDAISAAWNQVAPAKLKASA